MTVGRYGTGAKKNQKYIMRNFLEIPKFYPAGDVRRKSAAAVAHACVDQPQYSSAVHIVACGGGCALHRASADCSVGGRTELVRYLLPTYLVLPLAVWILITSCHLSMMQPIIFYSRIYVPVLIPE